ncbi:DUF5388 domain-containing protein [Exiguobacterium undae]|uniref:Replication-associated protein RepC n=1 Tax=Exiguobacterium undae TaxID=169177 RepID=A0ABX2V7W2_9BACL|nr:DUF5388 domain-containing protein [Exiguobacterium undae]OAN14066.1 hypothetical protein A3783_16070 [Exiguobacterium undae]
MANNQNQPQRKRLLERKSVATPQKIYSPEDVVVENNPNESKEEVTQSKRKKTTQRAVTNGSTTVRVSTNTKNQLAALVTMGMGESVDAVISTFIDDYVEGMASDQKKEYQILKDIMMMKTRKS